MNGLLKLIAHKVRVFLHTFYNSVGAMALASRIINVAIAMFILGAIGATAFVMASNATAYSGADATVVTIMTIAVPIMGGVAIMLALLRGR